MKRKTSEPKKINPCPICGKIPKTKGSDNTWWIEDSCFDTFPHYSQCLAVYNLIADDIEFSSELRAIKGIKKPSFNNGETFKHGDNDIANCIYCGSPQTIVHLEKDGKRFCFFVECSTCEFPKNFDTKQQAIQDWNCLTSNLKLSQLLENIAHENRHG